MRRVDGAGDSRPAAGTLGDSRSKISDADLPEPLGLRKPGHLILFKSDTDATVVHRDGCRLSSLCGDLLLHILAKLKVLRVREAVSDDRQFQGDQGRLGLPSPLHSSG